MKENKTKKLSLPIAVLITSVILSISYFTVQTIRQMSIEKQQKAELLQNEQKYISERRNECYEIYKNEQKGANNVLNNEYKKEDDVCIITYIYSIREWEDNNCDYLLRTYEFPDSKATNTLQSGIQEVRLNRYRKCISNTFIEKF